MTFVQNVGRRDEIESGEIGSFVVLGEQSLNGFERNKLYRNEGCGPDGIPTFSERSYLEGADRVEDGRGVVFSDIDADGDLDLIIQSYENRAVLLANQGVGVGNWLQVKLHGTESNREAIGARVVIECDGERQSREIATSAGYLSGQSLLAHFGVGDATEVDRLTVHWPSGRVSVLEDLAINQRIQIVEGEAGHHESSSRPAPIAP